MRLIELKARIAIDELNNKRAFDELMSSEDYPAKSDSDIVIDVLKKENDCAADEIVRLSKMIVDLGYDPTIK
jgi:hypothetical protein